MTYVYKSIQSPVGVLKLVASNKGLAGVLWENDSSSRVPHLNSAVEENMHPILLETENQLDQYFAGTRTIFTIDLDMTGTEFQKQVWTALLSIPFGETRSYGELAKQIGNPKASRAVGAANGKNPVSIITPCHRAIGSDGSLTGFAGGLKTKQYLLTLESKQLHLAA